MRRADSIAVLTLLPLALTGIVWAIGMRGAFWNYRHFSYDKPYILGEPQWSGGDIFEAMFLVGMPSACRWRCSRCWGCCGRRRPAGRGSGWCAGHPP